MNSLRLFAAAILYTGSVAAQQYVISTIAGGVPPPPGAALNASIGSPSGLATDSGNLYFTSLNCVFRVDVAGVLTRVAGNSRPGYSGDGGAATAAQLNRPLGLAFDAHGNLFVADSLNNRIRRITPAGIITTVAGTGVQGNAGDDGPATGAQLVYPAAVTVDGPGNLYIADYVHIREVSPQGIITTLAGNGIVGYGGDGGPALGAEFEYPSAIARDGAGNIFVADSNNQRIRKIDANGIITTVAGTGVRGFSGDSGPAAMAQLDFPYGVSLDNAGNLLIADSENSRIRIVSPDGIISTIAGAGFGYAGDGGPALKAQMYAPNAAVVDSSGNLFIADTNNYRLRKVSSNNVITTIAGNGAVAYSGDGGPATGAQVATPWGVAADTHGNIFFADAQENRVRKIAADGTISTVAGTGVPGFSGDGGQAAAAQFYAPYGSLIADPAGNLYVTDWGNGRIRKISANGIIKTIVGTGLDGFSGDGGPAVDAQIFGPNGIALDSSGNLYIADLYNARVRKVSADGIITTIAGNGTPAYAGDGGPALQAELNEPQSVAVDGSGNVYIADYLNNRVRMVSPEGIITTVAGGGSGPDGGRATDAALVSPVFVALDGAGNLFIVTGSFGNTVRKVSASGVITTVAGIPVPYGLEPGYTGDGGPATGAQMVQIQGLAIDPAGDIFIGDVRGSAVRRLTPASQSVIVDAVVNSASEMAAPLAPGQIVVIYGAGLGPPQGVTASPVNGVFSAQLAGTTVSFNGVPAPVYYASATQVNAIVPYEISGPAASVTVASQNGVSVPFAVPVAASAPGLFSYNATGAGQAAAVNFVDGTINTAANPVKIGDYIELYATGEGQTSPAGVDGRLAGLPLPAPTLPVSVTVGGVNAFVQYYGAAYGEVAGLMQVNVRIPPGVTAGGYVPVILTVGNTSTVSGALWIAVAN